MICELEGVNNRDDVEDLVVFSTDIEAMYPSLDTDQVAADLARESPLPRSRDGEWCFPGCWNMQCRITSILVTERQDVCEGTIIIEICSLCLCLCFYFESKVLNSPVPPLYFVTWLRWSYRSVHQFINYKNFSFLWLTFLHYKVTWGCPWRWSPVRTEDTLTHHNWTDILTTTWH